MAENVSPPPPPPPPPAEAPVDPLFTHPASPFIRTQAPESVGYASPPSAPTPLLPSAWSVYKAQIQFALALLAYLMVVIGAGTVVQANGGASWRVYVALLPAIPAAVVLVMFVRALGRLDEVKKRIQLQALGFTVGATGLLSFGYGFLEGTGMPHLNWTLVLPLMVLMWGTFTAAMELNLRFRR